MMNDDDVSNLIAHSSMIIYMEIAILFNVHRKLKDHSHLALCFPLSSSSVAIRIFTSLVGIDRKM